MELDLGLWVRRCRGVARGALAGAAFAGLAGCGCNPAPPASPPIAQSPASPLGAPRVQTPTHPGVATMTPTNPAPAPAVQTPATPKPVPKAPGPAAEAKSVAPPPLTMENISKVREGMSLIEVLNAVGRPGVVVSQTGDAVQISRWTSDDGAVLTARFEEGKLVRKSVLGQDGQEQSAADSPGLTRDGYDAILPGMTLDEVLEVLSIAPQTVNQGDSGVTIYRWNDKQGTSFTARFEDGKLVRKAGFHVKRAAASSPADAGEEAQEQSPSGAPVEESPEAPVAPGAPSIAEVEETFPRDVPVPATEAPAGLEKKPRVRVAGGSKAKGEEKGSFNPKAKLPGFTHGLRQGAFEIRVYNPGDAEAEVGLRSDKRGANLRIPARSSRSFKVDRGTYAFYFISESAPYTLNTGAPIVVDGMFATDLEISLIDDSFRIGVLNQGGGRY